MHFPTLSVTLYATSLESRVQRDLRLRSTCVPYMHMCMHMYMCVHLHRVTCHVSRVRAPAPAHSLRARRALSLLQNKSHTRSEYAYTRRTSGGAVRVTAGRIMVNACPMSHLCHLESEPGAFCCASPVLGHPAGAVYDARQSGSGACKSEPRDTRPLTHREGKRPRTRQVTPFGAFAAGRRIAFRQPCLSELSPAEGEGSRKDHPWSRKVPGRVQERSSMPRQGSRGPVCCDGWRRRLGVMTERETLTPSPRREDDWRRAPWCSHPRCWAPLLEEGSELPTRRGVQCLAGCWRGA
eukprot:scaffold18529_cov62-Phaeocystis_antarctica.AAC.6